MRYDLISGKLRWFVRHYSGIIVECVVGIRTGETYEVGSVRAKSYNTGGKNKKIRNNKNKAKATTLKPFLLLLIKETNHPQNKCLWKLDAGCYKCGQLGKDVHDSTAPSRSQSFCRSARRVLCGIMLFYQQLYRKLAYRWWLYKDLKSWTLQRAWRKYYL